MSLTDMNMAGLLKLSRYKLIGNYVKERYLILNGNGTGYFSVERDNSAGWPPWPTFNVTGVWEGFVTFITNLKGENDETIVVRFVFHDVDFDFVLGALGGILEFLWELFIEGETGIWYLDEDDDDWVHVFGDVTTPPAKGVASLFTTAKLTDLTGPYSIIPGDDVVFTALYVPAYITDWSYTEYYVKQYVQQGSQSQQPPGGGNRGSEKLTFKLEYGDGESQSFEVNYSDEPIKVDLGKHKYTSLGTYNAKLTVSGDPDADEDAIDAMKIDSEDKYLGVSNDKFYWNYDEVSDDGKIYGSFEVINLAHELYSGGYILEWKLDENYTNMKWGEWTFDRNNGSIPPNSSQIVNFVLMPPVYKTDYTEANITIIDTKNNRTKKVEFNLEYGYINLLPDSPITLYMLDGGTAKTFEERFWVYRMDWEKEGLPWEVNYTYSNANTNFSFTCIPDSGTIYRGDLPSVDLEIQPIAKGVYLG
jgi:hypothetical protein